MKPKETTITQERVKELIHYDPATGIFTRIKQSSGNYSRRRQIGQPSDHENKNYGMIRIDGQVHKSHRIAWLYMTGSWPSGVVDHKDGNKANNAFYNLRDCTQQQNLYNSPHPSGLNRAKGTTEFRGKFRARIRIDGKVRELGMFNTREEAHNAYIDAMHDYYGDKAFVIPDKPVKRDSSCHKVA